MWVYFLQGYTLRSQYHFAPITDLCTFSSFALFLAPMGSLPACSHGAAATYQFGSTFHLCRWYLAPMRQGVAAASLSTCWDAAYMPPPRGHNDCAVHNTSYHHNTVCCVQHFSSRREAGCIEGSLCFSLLWNFMKAYISFCCSLYYYIFFLSLFFILFFPPFVLVIVSLTLFLGYVEDKGK